MEAEYIAQGGKYHTKKAIIYDIIEDYSHDYAAEGNAISKRRLWYILKPSFSKAVMPVYVKKGIYDRRDPITNQDYNRYYNELAEEGIIDDTYIADNSRELAVGTLLPHIVLAPEKATIATTVKRLAESLGCSYYISSGQSSIYGAKKLLDMIVDTAFNSEDITVLTLTDHDKSGHSISNNIGKHFDVMEHRTLLTPQQVPEDKLDEWFAEWSDGTKAYELDVLNIHQLKDIFLDAIPEHIADEITEAHKKNLLSNIAEEEIAEAIDNDERIAAIDKQIQELEEDRSDLMEQLEPYYAEMYSAADPVTVDAFNVHDIVDRNITYDIAKWKHE